MEPETTGIPAAPEARRVGGTFRSLREHRNYRLYFFAQVVSYSGTYVQDTALPWLILELTHSPFQVGLLVLCRFGPATLLGLFTGAAADHFDNRRLLIATQATSMTIAATIAVLVFTGTAQPLLIFVLAAISGTVATFDSPTRQSLTFELVGREELPNAIALNASFLNTGRVVGPAVGGVLIAAYGVGWCFVVNTTSFVAVLGALLLIRGSELYHRDRSGDAPATVWSLIREAMAYLRGSMELQLIMMLGAVFGLFGFSALRTLLSVLASKTLQRGAETFGVLFASYGVGALAGALLIATLGKASWRWLFAGSLGYSIAMLVLAPTHNVVVAVSLIFVEGACWAVWSSQAQTLVQLAAPDHLRGRAVGLCSYGLTAGAPIGGLLAGWLAERGGTELALSVCGAAGLAASSAALVIHRRTGARSTAADVPLVPLADDAA
jgi:predicted MFS family arabinose efflux permease